MKKKKVACVFVCLIVCALSASTRGQTVLASVTGLVLDPNAAAIVEATVTAKNTDTGIETIVQTNSQGLYHFANLEPGNYEFSVAKHGFKAIVKPGVTLHLADTISMNFNMVVGAIVDRVTVEAGASMLNTTDASISTVVDQTYVKNMPLNGRSFQDLILLTPGAVTQTPQTNSGQSSAVGLGSSGEFSINGQRTESNYYTVDGVSANLGINANPSQGAGPSGSVAASTALGTTQALVSVDDLQEFRVQSSTYSAEYGRNPGGQFAFETKSGTNQWHGTAYDYLRNDYFDANDWFFDYFKPTEPTLTKPALRQNDFGGTLGGPVRIPGLYNGKDKSFFFVSYEGLRLMQPQPASVNDVPDLCMRGTGSCPSGSAPAASALGPAISAFPPPNGPELIEQCFSPGTPPCGTNGTGPSGLAQYIASWSNPSSLDSTSVRLDHVVSRKLRLFFRFSGSPSSVALRPGNSGGLSPSVVETTSYTVRTYTAGATAFFTNRLSDDLRFNYSSNYLTFNNTLDSFGGSMPSNFVKLLGLGSNGFIGFAIFSDDFAYNTLLTQGPSPAAQRQWNLVNTVSLSAGHHQFKFGLDYRRLAPFTTVNNPDVVYFYFGQTTVQSNSAAVGTQSNGAFYPLYQNFSAFAADEWKVLPRLSISMGLRWEVNPPPGVTQGLQAYTVQGSSPATWRLAPEGTPLWHTAWYNFAPRLGAAYTLRNGPNWETVVRGGGGVFFDTSQQLGSAGFLGPGFTAFSVPFFAPGSFPVVPAIPVITDPTQPPFNAGAPSVFPSHLQLPYTLQWNTSLEQALGNAQAVTLSYVGSHASRLLETQRLSIPTNPTYTNWSVIANGLKSDYDALQAQFRRRLGRGLTALASYTWSHCLDYGSMNFTSGFERGNCDFDLRHNFSGAFSYDLPNMGHNGFANALVHHWGLDDWFTARTGFPVDLLGQQFFDPITGNRQSNGLNFVPGKPIYVYGAQCEQVFGSSGTGFLLQGHGCPGGRGFNPNAFTPVASGFGNVPRNFARGFGAWQMNLAVRREFPIYENLKMQFRAEAFNIFNHPNFGRINPAWGQNNFGLATNTLATSQGSILSPLYQSGGPRSMQFALKVVF